MKSVLHNLYTSLLALLICSGLSAQGFPLANTKDIALFPQQNATRNSLDLSGVWNFQKDSLGVGEQQQWFLGLPAPRAIAVPGSWNEQFADSRDYLGLAWYETRTFVPAAWRGQQLYLRVGSANYLAKVWVNGKAVGMHAGGHLPFAFDISSYVTFGAANRITISIENELKPSRVPTGGAVAGGFFQSFPRANFDFFPYAGLNRAVWLYTTPAQASIKDITVTTTFEGRQGQVKVRVEKAGAATVGRLTLKGNGGEYALPLRFSGNTAEATLTVAEVRLWSTEDPFLYELTVSIGNERATIDQYELPVGVRTISTTDKQILLNGKPVFFKGFGKHEDFPIFGRGLALPVLIKDYALLKWVGANSYRTSHYPYDEEYMRMADREGILIINEIPAVGLFFHGDTLELAQRQQMCLQYIDELVTRDKNHPSVVMWSVANEPMPEQMNLSTDVKPADPRSVELFSEMFRRVKALDPTRLTTLVGVMGGPVEWLALSDVVCINRYWGWYTNQGDIATGAAMLSRELDDLYRRLQRPIIVSEFGADTYPGMHAEQPEMFTEEYQTAFIKAYLDVADTKDFVAGMHVWAFADFKTGQGVIRFGGINYKGVFTRDRKPKMSAHYLRNRWYTGE
jgi:beta-glucuronidase